jgi:hypothetical protein
MINSWSQVYDPYIAQYIPPKSIQSKLKDIEQDFIFNETETDLNKLIKSLMN